MRCEECGNSIDEIIVTSKYYLMEAFGQWDWYEDDAQVRVECGWCEVEIDDPR